VVVPMSTGHIHGVRGDPMEYALTQKIGNTTVNIVAPPPLTEEEKEKILNELHYAGWAIIYELLARGEEV